MDVRQYNLQKIPNVPKMLSQRGSEAGFIIPYDIWKKSDTTTYIFEGEKDMAMARTIGINAITLTGGAGAKPNEYVLNTFKNRDVVICYDNDSAGRDGMYNLYKHLKSVCKSVKYIDISEVCKEEKEDFYDFVMKYKKDAFDFYNLTEHTFIDKQEDIKKFTKIRDALDNNIVLKPLLAEVLVNAEFSDTYAVPAMVSIEKVDGDDGMMMKGDTVSWFLDKSNSHQMLELIEVAARKQDVLKNIKQYAGADQKGVKVSMQNYKTIYKVKVMDKDGESDKFSLDLYAFDQMFVGKQYEISYTIHPHPTKNQKLVAVADEVKELGEEADFKPKKEYLSLFQFKVTVEERLNYLYQSAKHHIAKHLNYTLWLMSDLVFNSVLEFHYDDKIRGTLDVFILGDTQVGKSETTSKLCSLYDFGHFLSLKTSTTVGLIGGSNKVDGSWMNVIGAIPRQHRRLAVLEEFSGAKPEFIKTMTEIRSSGKLRLARAAGELNVPCQLRMITISNPVNDDQGNPQFLSMFPNGVQPIMQLIKSAEDVARYDGFLLVSKVKDRVNPFSNKLEGTPIPVEAYKHKIKWVATRKVEDVVFADGSDSYIWERAQELNQLFESNFSLFGTTTDKKLARFSVALASLLMSTDANYDKVVVTKEIVDYMVQFLISVYDNNVFKLKEYKREFDSYSGITSVELNELQKLYPKNATMFEFLINQSSTSRANVRVISGLENDDFTKIFNQMTKHRFIRLSGETVFPTEKFRLGMEQINKTMRTDLGSLQVGTSDKLELKEKGKR